MMEEAMYKYCNDVVERRRDEDGNLACGNYFYGSQHRDDYMFRNTESLPRFGPLGRKLLMHYAAEHYNPHTICITQEPFIRRLIKSFIETKVFYKTNGYDWELIDHFCRKVIGEYYNLNLQYDMAVIDRGFGLGFKPPLFVDESIVN